MEPTKHENILQEIDEVEQELTHLSKQQKQAETKLQSLRERLAEHNSENGNQTITTPTTPVPTPNKLTREERISLFMRLFRGRDDVYPLLWEGKTSDSIGYSPVCANEWKPELCNKGPVKCGECPNRQFLPVTADVIEKHLLGEHTIGVYPMLKDETCWFLAADFDKKDWQADVRAFTETCRRVDIPYALERSRSGNGAHVWFFFDTPVSAATARRMGSYLLTETMARRHQLRMSSYDRLFPNQDTMPKGGFGNLIALPLQLKLRQKGNTLFLNDELEPYKDQWNFLSTLPHIPTADVERIAGEALASGQITGLQIAETGGDAYDASPWLRPPSREPTNAPITEPVPQQVHGVLSQRLFIEKKGLPSSLISQIKWLAAFQNPEFYRKQSLRLSTHQEARIISCAKDEEKYISMPRGCVGDVEDLLSEHHSTLEIEDLRNPGDAIEVNFSGKLSNAQKQATKTLLEHDNGIIVAPPGFGKTVLGTYLIAERKCSTLVIVHTKPLLKQWQAQIGIFLDRDAKSIGHVGGGAKRKLTGEVDVAMIQSLYRKKSVDNIVADYGQVIIDDNFAGSEIGRASERPKGAHHGWCASTSSPAIRLI